MYYLIKIWGFLTKIHKTMLLLRCALFCELGKPKRFEINGLFVDLISLGNTAEA